MMYKVLLELMAIIYVHAYWVGKNVAHQKGGVSRKAKLRLFVFILSGDG